MTYTKIEKNMGIFWPCPDFKHPGTPRLFEGGRFNHDDGRARFHGFEYRPPAEDVDSEYPIFFTSGRVVSQYLSGNQTRRIGSLVDYFKPEDKQLFCPCHKGIFSATAGTVLAGPPKRALDALAVSVMNGEVWVRFPETENI